MCETRRVSRSWCNKLYTHVLILRLSTSHLYPHLDVWNLAYQWLELGIMSWDICPTQLILPTIIKLQVLYLLCQQAAFLRVLALQLEDVALNVFAIDVDFRLPRTEFFWPGGRSGRHLASCTVSTFALQGSNLMSCMSIALEQFYKLRIFSKLQNGASSPVHLSTCVKFWRMSGSLDTSATGLSESVKGVHSSTNLLSTCSLPVLG